MNNKYHSYIEKYYKTYDTGEHSYQSGIFRRTKSARTRLPIEMYKRGLMIIGCNTTDRRKFTAHYAKTLLKEGKKVIYITDALTAMPEQIDEVRKEFYRNIGINSHTKSDILLEEYNGEYNKTFFEAGGSFHAINFSLENSPEYIRAQREYDNKLLDLLEQIIEAEISHLNSDSSNSTSNLVIFIDDDNYSQSMDSDRIRSIYQTLLNYNIGVVISNPEGRRFYPIIKDFIHYVFFRMEDPIETVCALPSFRIRSVDKIYDYKSTKQHVTTLCSRDLVQLKSNEFHYFQTEIFGFSNRCHFST